MGQSAGTLSQKENGHIKWQQDDLEFFNGRGLSSDFVLGFRSVNADPVDRQPPRMRQGVA
jgi:hypothetical protein